MDWLDHSLKMRESYLLRVSYVWCNAFWVYIQDAWTFTVSFQWPGLSSGSSTQSYMAELILTTVKLTVRDIHVIFNLPCNEYWAEGSENRYRLPMASCVIRDAGRLFDKGEKVHYRPMLHIRSIRADWSLATCQVSTTDQLVWYSVSILSYIWEIMFYLFLISIFPYLFVWRYSQICPMLDRYSLHTQHIVHCQWMEPCRWWEK